MSTDEDYYKLLGCSETSTASFVVINLSTYHNLPKIGPPKMGEVNGSLSRWFPVNVLTVPPRITYSSNGSPLK